MVRRGGCRPLGMMALSGAITRWVKVSVHMAFAALAGNRVGPGAIADWLLCCCLCCRHSRGLGCVLQRHTPLEVVLGTIIGAGAGSCNTFPVTGEQVLIRPRQPVRRSPSFSPRSIAAAGSIIPGCSLRTPPLPIATTCRSTRNHKGIAFFIWLEASRGLVGVVNVSEIVQGCFRSVYLGDYVFVPFAGRGLMKEGLAQVITHVFQVSGSFIASRPTFNRPIARRKRWSRNLDPRREGLSPRYLKINGRWRDHERWAILSEDW